MSNVMVLISSIRRTARESTIFIEPSRLRDYIARVTDILARIHGAFYGEMCIGHIESL
jgi:hypothetical protein